ncbi:MAG TPA: ribbon-helix-helix protein, CopG family [Chloroflexota bacterium]
MLTMPAELLDEVDALARRTGRKRSQLVRQALHELLDRQRRREFEELLADGYREMAEDAAVVAADGQTLQAEAARDVWRWDE